MFNLPPYIHIAPQYIICIYIAYIETWFMYDHFFEVSFCSEQSNIQVENFSDLIRSMPDGHVLLLPYRHDVRRTPNHSIHVLWCVGPILSVMIVSNSENLFVSFFMPRLQ